MKLNKNLTQVKKKKTGFEADACKAYVIIQFKN